MTLLNKNNLISIIILPKANKTQTYYLSTVATQTLLNVYGSCLSNLRTEMKFKLVINVHHTA